MNEGRWTREEKVRDAEAIHKYGFKSKKIAGYINTRTRGQVRSHHQHFADIHDPIPSLSMGASTIITNFLAIREQKAKTNLEHHSELNPTTSGDTTRLSLSPMMTSYLSQAISTIPSMAGLNGDQALTKEFAVYLACGIIKQELESQSVNQHSMYDPLASESPYESRPENLPIPQVSPPSGHASLAMRHNFDNLLDEE